MSCIDRKPSACDRLLPEEALTTAAAAAATTCLVAPVLPKPSKIEWTTSVADGAQDDPTSPGAALSSAEEAVLKASACEAGMAPDEAEA